MNKLIRISIYIVLLFSIFGCNSKVLLNRTDSEKEIIIRMNRENKVVTTIQFPFYITINNTSFMKRYFCDIDYHYTNNKRLSGIRLYNNNEDVSCNGLKEISAKSTIKYFAYSGRFIDFSDFTQEQLRSYVEKMLILNQDTLHIGTVTEFKAKHRELLEILTEHDTISILNLKSNKSWEGTRIAVPANW